MREMRDGSNFLEPRDFGSKNGRFGQISPRNRQPGLRIEMHAAGLRRRAELIRRGQSRRDEGRKKQKRTGPGKTGGDALQQGLLPCQFIVRRWLPVFSDGRLDREAERKSLLF
jgi:hypothetical protein